MLLALDTATPATTVALAEHGTVLAEYTAIEPRRHGEVLAVAIQTVLNKAGAAMRDIRQVAVGVGPGPYTGLRVGVVTGRALGGALQVPVVGVCTLDTLGYAAALPGEFLVATDARRKEVYWTRYRDGLRVAGPGVDRPADVAYDGPVVGQGALLYPEAFPDVRPPEHPSAAAMCSYVGSGAPTLDPLPLYLRRPDTAAPKVPKRVS
jgi:tRNA threonylcarbamoyl adenosine modification protein YeaZ